MIGKLIETMTRGSVLLGGAVAFGVFAAGTTLTLRLVSDGSGEMLDPYKVGGTWMILGAIIGRMVFNLMTPKPND